jgi:N-acetylmuramoyl-L-alanine amidase
MFANQAAADYFFSIHINAGGGTGFETFVYTGSSGATAAYQNVIHKRISLLYEMSGFPNRGQKQANLAVLRETHMPALLLEYGFIDNAKDAAKLADPDWIERLAQATAAGVASSFGLPEPKMSEPKEEISDWAKEAHAWAIECGITDGTRPKDAVTREEVITMLYRALK